MSVASSTSSRYRSSKQNIKGIKKKKKAQKLKVIYNYYNDMK